MILDVDFLISFFQKHSDKGRDAEMKEQEAAAPSGGSTAGTGKAVPKWVDTYPLKRGKANPLTKSGEKWETGLTRGAANQIW